jgi:uncharacterized protein (TIGR03066 family)
MKTCSARCLIRFVTAVALLFAVLVPASFAEDSAALNKPEKLIGKWKSVGDPISLEGAKMVVSFAENGEFALSITGESGRKSEHKGTYSAVTAPGGYYEGHDDHWRTQGLLDDPRAARQ